MEINFKKKQQIVYKDKAARLLDQGATLNNHVHKSNCFIPSPSDSICLLTFSKQCQIIAEK